VRLNLGRHILDLGGDDMVRDDGREPIEPEGGDLGEERAFRRDALWWWWVMIEIV
jgi:hypothetical protein